MNSNRSNSEQVNEADLGMAAVPDASWETEAYLRMISLLNHYRHDWMNEIQLLFGYIKLKKYDKLDGLMEKIKVKVQRESLLSKLGAPELIVYLFSFLAEVKDLPLELHIEQEIHFHELFLDPDAVGVLLINVMDLLKSHALAHPEDEHRLTLRLKLDSEGLIVAFDYTGKLTQLWVNEQLEPVLQQGKPIKWLVTSEDYQTGIVITIPLNT